MCVCDTKQDKPRMNHATGFQNHKMWLHMNNCLENTF